MTAGGWISTPGGRFRPPASPDVPTASGTIVIAEGGRLLVCLTRPALHPENVGRVGAEQELEVVAAFGLARESVQAHLAVPHATEDGAP